MARKVTVEKFKAWIADEDNVIEVLDRLAENHLHKVAVALKQPYTCLYEYFMSTPELEKRYTAACKARVDRRADESQDIADNVKPEKGHVAKAKLQVDVRHLQAKSYNPERWGDRVKIDKPAGTPGDAALLGFASELLKLVKKDEPRVIEGEVVRQALPAEKDSG